MTAVIVLLQLVAVAAAHAAIRSRPAAVGAPCLDAGLVPLSANIPRVAAATLCLVNQQRVMRGEVALVNNADLDRSASRHTENMVADDYFAHVSPAGGTPLQRILASGYVERGDAYELGENIALGTAWLATPAATVKAWMSSPDHRANILDPDFTATGIGVVAQVPSEYADGEAGATYTQDFGVLQAP